MHAYLQEIQAIDNAMKKSKFGQGASNYCLPGTVEYTGMPCCSALFISMIIVFGLLLDE